MHPCGLLTCTAQHCSSLLWHPEWYGIQSEVENVNNIWVNKNYIEERNSEILACRSKNWAQKFYILQHKRAGFPRLRRPFSEAGRLPPCVSCSAPFHSSISSPPLPSFSFQHRWRTCHGGIFIFLCLAARPRCNMPVGALHDVGSPTPFLGLPASFFNARGLPPHVSWYSSTQHVQIFQHSVFLYHRRCWCATIISCFSWELFTLHTLNYIIVWKCSVPSIWAKWGHALVSVKTTNIISDQKKSCACAREKIVLSTVGTKDGIYQCWAPFNREGSYAD